MMGPGAMTFHRKLEVPDCKPPLIMNYAISFTPTTSHLQQIEKWLIDEKNNSGEGFYVNWSIINAFFNRKELAVLTVDNDAVGFCCWRTTSDFSGQFNILEIHPTYRGKGLGAWFNSELEKFFVSNNILVVDVQCVPETSEAFWRKMNFIDVPPNHRFWDKQTTHLFKCLVPSLQPVVEHNNINYIEIWDAEPYATVDKDAKWKWDLDITGENKLVLPIIQPCHRDWRIRLVLDNKTITDNKVKRFGELEIDYGPYIIIQELPV